MEPVIRSTILLTLKSNHFPSGGSGLSEIVPSIGPLLATLCVVPRLHDNIPARKTINTLGNRKEGILESNKTP